MLGARTYTSGCFKAVLAAILSLKVRFDPIRGWGDLRRFDAGLAPGAIRVGP